MQRVCVLCLCLITLIVNFLRSLRRSLTPAFTIAAIRKHLPFYDSEVGFLSLSFSATLSVDADKVMTPLPDNPDGATHRRSGMVPIQRLFSMQTPTDNVHTMKMNHVATSIDISAYV